MTTDALKNIDADQFGTQQTTSTSTAGGIVDLLTPVDLIWLREVPISTSALVSANTTKKVLDFDPDDTNIPLEGVWVTLDQSTGEASTIGTRGSYGFLVYAGRGRLDIPASEGVTVLCGGYTAEVSRFDSEISSSTAFGAALTTNASGILELADTDDDRVVAHFEGVETRNGVSLIRINTVGAGWKFKA